MVLVLGDVQPPVSDVHGPLGLEPCCRVIALQLALSLNVNETDIMSSETSDILVIAAVAGIGVAVGPAPEPEDGVAVGPAPEPEVGNGVAVGDTLFKETVQTTKTFESKGCLTVTCQVLPIISTLVTTFILLLEGSAVIVNPEVLTDMLEEPGSEVVGEIV